MSTIPKEFFNTPQQIKDKVCEVFTKEQSPYMYDSLRQAAYYGYRLATDGREELEEMAKEVLRIVKERDRLKVVIENIEKEYQNIYKALDELAVQYELSAENKFKELGIPLNEEYLPTLFKAKEILNKTKTSGELFKKIIKD